MAGRSAVTSGPIFRRILPGGRAGEALSDHAAALIVKRAAKAARLDPALFSGHSLRSGFVTSALARGTDLFRVMDVTRHREVNCASTTGAPRRSRIIQKGLLERHELRLLAIEIRRKASRRPREC